MHINGDYIFLSYSVVLNNERVMINPFKKKSQLNQKK